MNTKKLLSLWGLKWNPFSPELPSDALLVTGRIENFAWRVEQLVQEGGFALITGEPGTGKSVTLRVLRDRLASLPDITVAIVSRPQSGVADFYRELGDVFSVKLSPLDLCTVIRRTASTESSPARSISAMLTGRLPSFRCVSPS